MQQLDSELVSIILDFIDDADPNKLVLNDWCCYNESTDWGLSSSWPASLVVAVVGQFVCRAWHKIFSQYASMLRDQRYHRRGAFTRRVAVNGWVSVLTWAIAIGCSKDWYGTMEAATIGGHLDILQWASEESVRGEEKEGLRLQGHSKLLCTAARFGQLKIAKWLLGHGCAWGSNYWREPHELVTTAAARGGHLDVLQWAIKEGCHLDDFTCVFAAEGGHLEVLKWLDAFQDSSRCRVTRYCYDYAAMAGHLDILRWLHGILGNEDFDANVMASAARWGHLEAVKWLHEMGCPWDDSACYFAAQHGHLEVLKWLREKGCPWDWGVCSIAEHFGFAELLQWAKENGCPEKKSPKDDVEDEDSTSLGILFDDAIDMGELFFGADDDDIY